MELDTQFATSKEELHDIEHQLKDKYPTHINHKRTAESCFEMLWMSDPGHEGSLMKRLFALRQFSI
jgi:hypothetical protein